MNTKTEAMTLEFAAALSCRPKFVQTRLIALGHSTVCGRCGGSGSYSYCQMYGRTCFGCSGSGKVATKLTKTLLAQVKTQVAAGEMQPYLNQIAARAAAKKTVDSIFGIWGSLPTVAADAGKHFSLCSDRCHDINAFCSHLYDIIKHLVREIETAPLSSEDVINRNDQISKLAGLMAQAESLAIPRPKYEDNRQIPAEAAAWKSYMAGLLAG